jgi:hypothetical protein
MRWIVLSLFLFAGLARAQSMPVPRSAIDMMPGLEDAERNPLYRVWYDIAGKLKGADQKRVAELRSEFWRRMKEAGLDDAGLTRLRRMPTGALREERYNHSVLLESADLTERQRTLVIRCVSAVDGAQRALHAQLQALGTSMKGTEEVVRRQVRSSFQQQRQQMEKRFWHVLNYALLPAQMRQARERFSPRYRYVPDLQQQLLLTPGVTPSQANRIRARFAEHQSETTADRAELAQIRAKLADRSLPKKQREELQGRSREAQARLKQLNYALRDGLREVLTEEQLAEFRSLPPVLGVGDRRRGLRKALAEMGLTPRQQKRVAAIRKEAEAEAKEVRADLEAKVRDMKGAQLGPDSPQMMTMEMMQRGAQSQLMSRVREHGHRVVVEVLEPTQASDWIIAPALKP